MSAVVAVAAAVPLLCAAALPSTLPSALGAVATAAAPADGPVQQQIAVAQDASVVPRGPGAADVAGPTLLAGDEQLDGHVSYLTFPLPTLPWNATAVSVTLQLHQVSPSGTSSSVTLYGVFDPWDVASLAPTDAPGLASPLGYADALAPPGVTGIRVPTSRLRWGGPVSFGLTADTGAASAVAFASSRAADPATWPVLAISYLVPGGGGCGLSAELVPSCGALVGSTANPQGAEATPNDAVARLETELGRRLDIVHVYHSGAEDWPTPGELALTTDPANPRILMVNWKPDRGTSWADVAAGGVDPLIDAEAARLVTRLAGRPFFLTLHHEPEDEVAGAGSGFTATDYVAMFRHVVERLRADGVTGAVVVWDVMGYAPWGDQGYYDALYPGDDVVDWIGYDPYSHDGSPLSTFADRPGRTFPGFYTWATSVHPSKPLMLAEFGVSGPSGGVRAAVFSSLAAQAAALPALKAFVYFDHPNDATTGGFDYSLEGDPAVLSAASAAFTSPYFSH